MVNQSNTGYFTGETGNPPVVTPLSGQAAERRPATSSSTTRSAAARRVGVAPTFTDPNFLPGGCSPGTSNVEREIGAHGRDGRLLRIARRSAAHSDQPQSVHDARAARSRPYPSCRRPSPILPGAALGNITEADQPRLVRLQGLWVTANRRLSHGLQLQASYTLSKSTDTNSYDGTGAQNNGSLQDSTNLAGSEAAVGLRRPPSLRVNAYVRAAVPRQPARRTAGRSSSSSRLQTGNPLNVITNITTITGVRHVRPDLIGTLPAIVPTPNIDQERVPGQLSVVRRPDDRLRSAHCRGAAGACTSSSVFALPYYGERRRALRQPCRGTRSSDRVSATRTCRSSRTSRWSAARARSSAWRSSTCSTRRTSVSRGATATVGSTSFGVITNTRFPTGDSGSARQIQFAAKFLF
mgnify:CR=1 FL=1